jgi:hypothetical protein
MTLPQVADSLAGRMELAELLPLSQSELHSARSNLLERAFHSKPPAIGELLTGSKLVQIVLAGGYPEALGRTSLPRRQKWFSDYIKAIIERDVRDIAQIDHARLMPRLLRVLAHHSGQLVNYSSLGAPLGMNHVTTRKYADIFENLFLIRTLEPWYSNELRRLVKTPKLHFLDSGLLAAMRSLSSVRLQSDRTPFGFLANSSSSQVGALSGTIFSTFATDTTTRLISSSRIRMASSSASKSRLLLPSEGMISPVCASWRKPAANASYSVSCSTISILSCRSDSGCSRRRFLRCGEKGTRSKQPRV